MLSQYATKVIKCSATNTYLSGTLNGQLVAYGQ